jgi:hypothetical protein
MDIIPRRHYTTFVKSLHVHVCEVVIYTIVHVCEVLIYTIVQQRRYEHWCVMFEYVCMWVCV